MVDPLVQAQMKQYDEALSLFHQQKFQRAKQELEKVVVGPSKELADRARMHIKIAEQRMKPSPGHSSSSHESIARMSKPNYAPAITSGRVHQSLWLCPPRKAFFHVLRKVKIGTTDQLPSIIAPTDWATTPPSTLRRVFSG